MKNLHGTVWLLILVKGVIENKRGAKVYEFPSGKKKFNTLKAKFDAIIHDNVFAVIFTEK